MSLLVNIIGTNGSGKSVFPKYLAATDPDTYTEKWAPEIERGAIITVFPNFGWAPVGNYANGKNGGCDGLRKSGYSPP
jgi:hypothetical protein